MTAFPSPSDSAIQSAFRRHGVRFVVAPLLAGSRGRPWSSGLRAIVDHHTAGTNSLRHLQNPGGTFPFTQTLIQRDGLVQLLSTRSCWGSGTGGPWPGIAGRDSLHLVAWQNEVEDLGQGRTFTAAQMESLGRINAALVSLGVPAANEINHRDWTDGTAPVGGFPLPTRGRKVDTRYSGDELRANTRKYRLGGTTNPPAGGGSGGSNVSISDNDVERIARRAAQIVWNSTWREYIDENGNGERDQRTAVDVLYATHAASVRSDRQTRG
jgi:hypothetical protein